MTLEADARLIGGLAEQLKRAEDMRAKGTIVLLKALLFNAATGKFCGTVTRVKCS